MQLDNTVATPNGAPALGVDLTRGTVIGRNVVLNKLGTGGMGIVYAAYDPELDRKVALKLLRIDLGATEGRRGEGRTRMIREAQALAKLSHPNVVSIYDVGVIGDNVWLAMDFVDGQTLGEWCEQGRSWQDTLEIMTHAGRGLEAAHRAGLVHRDFKPDNVMVGNDGRARVMDLGLARWSNDGERKELNVIDLLGADTDVRPEFAALAMRRVGRCSRRAGGPWRILRPTPP